MDLFLARQPIFNPDLTVHGYELVHRPCLPPGQDGPDEQLCAMQAMIDALMTFGPQKFLSGKRGHIRLGPEVLASGMLMDLPPEAFVFEVSASGTDAGFIETCDDLRCQGYTLALADAAAEGPGSPLRRQAEFARVDFAATSPAERQRLVRERPPGVRLLAENVATYGDYAAASSEGFSAFQGGFFLEPVLDERKTIRPLKLNLLRLLAEIQQRDLDLRQVEAIIKQDASLCFGLLRYMNSAAFGCRVPVTSVRMALTLLGENEIKRWASVATLPGLAMDKPDELVATAVMRAHFCELIAPLAGFGHRVSEMFLLGMASLLDAMVDRPMEELVAELRLAPDIGDALLGELPRQNGLMQVCTLVRACECAAWEDAAGAARRLGLPLESITEMYLKSIAWSFRITHPDSALHRSLEPDRADLPAGAPPKRAGGADAVIPFTMPGGDGRAEPARMQPYLPPAFAPARKPGAERRAAAAARALLDTAFLLLKALLHWVSPGAMPPPLSLNTPSLLARRALAAPMMRMRPGNGAVGSVD